MQDSSLHLPLTVFAIIVCVKVFYVLYDIWILRLIRYTKQNRINGGLTIGSIYDVCNNLLDVSQVIWSRCR